MKKNFINKKSLIYLNKLKLLIIFFNVCNFFFIALPKKYIHNENIKIALCTMGKDENLYVKEFIEYYIQLGIDHLFIYDDNDNDSEKLNDIIDKRYKNKVSVYETKQYNIINQSLAFSKCYNNNLNLFDWFLMVDMDEFLYIVNNTLKKYLTNKRFNKCDFIKFNWVIPKDNDLIYYDPRPLFERFKPPYIKSEFVKSIIRGNISHLRYWVHSPYISPNKNVTCNNIGKRIYYKNLNLESIRPINIKMAYIIHFRYKSTQEFINKLKRGYRNWFKDDLQKFLIGNIIIYLKINNATHEKINYIQKELNLNLSNYMSKIDKASKLKSFFKKMISIFN